MRVDEGTDRQTGRKEGRQAGRKVGRQAGRQEGRQTDRQTDIFKQAGIKPWLFLRCCTKLSAFQVEIFYFPLSYILASNMFLLQGESRRSQCPGGLAIWGNVSG